MGFLDNSGDIILDAVLTDTGRMRLAKGDGSFRITKFALADDEIDYSLFDRSNPNGSAYYDLEILQTPVLEAFTNNGSSMKNKLITITRNNLLFLPVIKLNTYSDSKTAIPQLVSNGYILAVDETTQTYLNSNPSYVSNTETTSIGTDGILRGVTLSAGAHIRVDQGIDNIKVPFAIELDPDLKESQYIIEMDNRLMSMVDTVGTTFPVPSYIDDDDIASYYLSDDNTNKFITNNTNRTNQDQQVIAGSRGTTLKFKLKASVETNTSDYLFNQFGSSLTMTGGDTTPTTVVKSILTSINITGVTTGFGIDIPIRLIKKIA